MLQVEMALPVCKLARCISNVHRLGAEVAAAWYSAQSGRPGPVHLSIPFDVLEADIAEPNRVNMTAPVSQSVCDEATAGALFGYLQAATRPLILTGPALMREPVLNRLTQATGIPVIGMESPRGINDPALGKLAQVLARADLVLLLAKPLDFTLRFGQSLAQDCVLLQVDPDPAMLLRTRRNLDGSLSLTFGAQAEGLDCAERLLEQYRGKDIRANYGGWFDEVSMALAFRPEAWATVCAEENALHPVELCRGLSSFIESSEQAILIADGGEFGQWAQACLTAPIRLINGLAGAIGGALPMAIAARLAHPQADIFVLCGDGTFGFHMAEIDTAVRYQLPFIVIIGNDARWNAEHQIQLRNYGPERLSGCDLLPTRYDLVAQAMGAHGEYVTQAEQLKTAVQRARESALPACINVVLESHPAPVF